MLSAEMSNSLSHVQMARQMRLSRQEFLDAVDCPLNQEAYHALLRQRLEAR